MTGLLRQLAYKILALALLAAAALLAYAVIAAPLMMRVSDLRAEIGEQRKLLGRLNAAASQEAIARDFEARARSGTVRGNYLPGATDAARIAELQSLAGKITNDEGVTIRSTRALPPRDTGNVRLLGLEAHMTCTIGQLQRILHQIEQGQPTILVETLHVAAPPVLSDSDPAANARLEVRLGLLGAAPPGKG